MIILFEIIIKPFKVETFLILMYILNYFYKLLNNIFY